MARELSIRITGDDSSAAAALARTEKGVQGVTAAAGGMGKAAEDAQKKVGGIAWTNASAEEAQRNIKGMSDFMVRGVQAALDFAGQLSKLSERTGVTVEDLQRINLVAVQSGTSLETAARGITSLQRGLFEASKNEKSPIAVTLRELELDINKLLDMNPGQMFFTIAEAISKIPNQAERTAVAMRLMKGAGDDLLPVMLADVQKLTAGTTVWSASTVSSMERVNSIWERTKIGFVTGIGELLGGFTSFDGALSVISTNPWALNYGKSFEQNKRDTKQWFADVKVILDAVKVLWTDLPGALRAIVVIIKTEIDKIPAAWTAAKTSILTTVEAIYTGVKTWLVDKFTSIVQGAKEKIGAVTGFFKDMYDKVVGHSYVPDLIRETGGWFDKLEALMVAPTRGAVSGVLALFDTLTAGATGKLKSFFDTLKGIAGQIFGGGQGGGVLGGLFGGGGSNPITSAGGLFGMGGGQPFTLGADGSRIPTAAGIGNLARFGGGGLMALTGGISLVQNARAGNRGASALSGAQTGAGIGTMIAPGIGTAIGAGIGALGGFVASLFGKGKGRASMEEFFDTFDSSLQDSISGVDEMRDRLYAIGREDLWLKVGKVPKGNLEAAQQLQRQITDAFEAQERHTAAVTSAFGTLESAVAGFGNRAPASLRPMVTELLGMKGLTGDMKGVLEGLLQPASWQDVGAAADRLGVKFDKLGTGWNQERISASALQMVRDLDLIKDAGGDMNGVLADAAGNINKLVNDARTSGVALPETLKPYIQKLIDLKLLVAPNGELVTNIDDLSFADIEDQGLKDIKKVLEEIRDLLSGELPKAVDTAELKFRGFKPKITVGVDYDYSALDPRRYIHGDAGGEGVDAPALASGGIVRARPGGTLVRVGEGGHDEAVTPLDGRGQTVIHIDARGALFPDRQSLQQFGKVIAPHVASGALSFVSR